MDSKKRPEGVPGSSGKWGKSVWDSLDTKSTTEFVFGLVVVAAFLIIPYLMSASKLAGWW